MTIVSFARGLCDPDYSPFTMGFQIKRRKNEVEDEMILSRWTKFGYSVGHVLNDLCSSLWFTYALIFYNQVVCFDRESSGALILVGQIADAAATPLVGYVSDRQFCSNRYGQRKTWHLVGTIGVVLSLPFMFSPCIGCEKSSLHAKMAYYSVFIVVFQWAWAFVQISHLSLATDLTPNDNERTHLLSLRTTFSVLSNISVSAFVLAVFASFSLDVINSSSMRNFQIIAYSIVITGAVATIIFHILVKETPPDEALLGDTSSTRNSYKSIFKRFALYQVAVLYLSARLYGNIIQAYIPLYVQFVLQLNAQAIAVLPLVMYISSFLTSFITRPLNKKLGRKIAYTFGGIVAAGGVLGIALGDSDLYKYYFIYIVAILLGSAQCTFLVTSLGIISDLIGNDIGNGAFIYGLMSFTDKLSSGAAIMAIQSFNNQNEEMGSKYYQYAIVIVCGTSAVVGTLAALTLRLRQRDVTEPEVPNPNPSEGAEPA